MNFTDFLKSLYPDTHNVDGQVYNAILGAIGSVLDKYEPFVLEIPLEFSINKASGAALDRHGEDWNVKRKADETDDKYRDRLMTTLAYLAQRHTLPGLKLAVAPFTGYEPILVDNCWEGFSFLDCAFSEHSFCDYETIFTVEIKVQNPDNVDYNHKNLERAVRNAKPARTRALIYHNGNDTSNRQAADAVVTII